MALQTIDLRQGDCVEVMKELSEGSVEAFVCDPPYGLKFMGKEFDDLGEGEAQRLWHKDWLEQAYRVLKPGGIIKAFGGTRTLHHLAAAMEDVGFQNISLEAWAYGSGFPKSMNIGKALDKRRVGNDLIRPWLRTLGTRKEIARAAKVTSRQIDHYLGENTTCPQTLPENKFRLLCAAFGDTPAWADEMYAKVGEVVGTTTHSRSGGKDFAKIPGSRATSKIEVITAPATDVAQKWDGWGTALKPAWEPVVIGYKP